MTRTLLAVGPLVGRGGTQGQQEHVEDEGGRDGGDDQAGGGRGHLLGDGRDRSGYLTG